MFDIRNKLEIFAVKSGLKKAVLAEVSQGSDWNNLSRLKKLAKILELRCKSTIAPPFYFLREPVVNAEFLKNYYQNEKIEVLWIYGNIEVNSDIIRCISGQLNEGYILGYPKCCIKWHEGCRVIEVEETFNELVGCTHSNPNLKKKLEESIDSHLIATWKIFPFVPHWACSDCLTNKSHETELLNKKYAELAKDLGFERDFLSKVGGFCKKIERI